jgi:hypothetical protein
MAENYVLLETISLTQTAASVTFDNLPTSGYTDLKVVISGRSNRATEIRDEVFVRFNGDSGANYSYKTIRGSGSGPFSLTASGTNQLNRNDVTGSGATANTFGNYELYIPNYRGSTQKSVSIDSVMETNATESYTYMMAGLWSGTASITSITISPEVSTWVANSTFSLYGVADVNTTPVTAPLATGGNIVANDGTYWYHAFLSSGTFTPQTTLSCDVLVVAGGGGGGGGANNFGGGGGGGAGGLLGFASESFSTATTVTVGSGGAGGTTAGTAGTVGVDSQCGSLTLVKGGGGGGTYSGTTSGGTGGSGGGASQNGSGGAATSGQGNAGGTGTSSGSYWGGSGGGAGSAATNASGATSSTAGAGTNTNATYGSFAATVSATTTGVSGYFAGGGGGGNGLGATGSTGGSGGGGNAGVSGGADGSAGTANSGGGGGGCSILSAAKNGGNGASGIVIVRYEMV